MSTYNDPVGITVEFDVDTGDRFDRTVWAFGPFETTSARKLYDALEATQTLMADRRPQQLTLVYWDRHPSHDAAAGMIVERARFGD